MRRELLLRALAMAMVGAWLTAAPAHGAMLILGGPEGTEQPPVPSECDSEEEEECPTTEEDWNPTITCGIGPGEGIDELLECLEDEIENPPPACHPITTTGGQNCGYRHVMQNHGDDDCNQRLGNGLHACHGDAHRDRAEAGLRQRRTPLAQCEPLDEHWLREP